MHNKELEIVLNSPIAKDVFKMEMRSGDPLGIERAGQFVNIKLEGFYLRRPISICDWGEKTLTIIYKTVGKGTKFMSELGAGSRLSVLLPLGNGFNLSKSGDIPLLIGGGVGTPPMYAAAKRLVEMGKKPTAILGFGSKCDVLYKDEFEKLGVKTIITTADGSEGIKGFVTDAIKDIECSYYYACGPEPMLKAVYESVQANGELSFEERMGCGFGACMGCSCKTKYGAKRICKDGPVLEKEEIIW